MSVNYAEKWESLLDKALTTEGFSNGFCNRKYNWVGVNTIHVQSINTVALDDYDKAGTGNRFGTSHELENSVQDMLVSQDKGFDITIDRATLEDTNFAINASEVMGAELREQVIPVIDKYVLAKIASADTAKDTTELTKSNAYEVFMSLNTRLDNAQVPAVGRVCAVKPEIYAKLMLDPSFVKASDTSMAMTLKGFRGTIEDVAIIRIPALYFPTGVDMIMTHPMATVKADKTDMTRLLTNVREIDGAVLQGRFRFDAFVLNKKIGCIATHGTSDTPTLYTVTYNGNGNDAGTVPSAQTQSAEGASITIASGSGLSKSSKAFKEWNTASGGTGVTVSGNYRPTANVTLYAIYED